MGQSFSIDYDGIANCLPIFVKVTNYRSKVTREYKAVLDTGATNTVISQKVFYELKLAKSDVVNVASANGICVVPLTNIDLVLSNKIVFTNLNVTVCNLPKDIDLLLGMDIITQGDLSVTNWEKTVLEFETPARRPCECSE